MDERALKRLLLILVVSVIVIMAARFMLTKTYTALNKAAVEKKQSSVRLQTPPPSDITPAIEQFETAASAVTPAYAAASSVEQVAQ